MIESLRKIIPFLQNYKISFLTASPGGFFVFGVLIAVVNIITKGRAPKKKSFSCEGCPAASACGGECDSCENKESKEDN